MQKKLGKIPDTGTRYRLIFSSFGKAKEDGVEEGVEKRREDFVSRFPDAAATCGWTNGTTSPETQSKRCAVGMNNGTTVGTVRAAGAIRVWPRGNAPCQDVERLDWLLGCDDASVRRRCFASAPGRIAQARGNIQDT